MLKLFSHPCAMFMINVDDQCWDNIVGSTSNGETFCDYDDSENCETLFLTDLRNQEPLMFCVYMVL